MACRLFAPIGVVFLAAALLAPAYGSDILMNGDFSDSKTHWHGDGDAPDVGGKLVITLKPDRWTAVTQRFNADATALKMKVVYTLSDDCSLGKGGDQLVPPLTGAALYEACREENDISTIMFPSADLFTVLIVTGGYAMSENPVSKPADGLSGEKTFSTNISAWTQRFVNCAICLCFPPGTGTVTLTHIELDPPGN